ncbi:Nuclear receptor 2C2-associated protein, partial [Rhizophlyctis rosea]
GTPQWILIDLLTPSPLTTLTLMFQGGFAGKDCDLLAVPSTATSDDEWRHVLSFYPEDNNQRQVFSVPEDVREERWRKLRVVFKGSTDFYGRVVVYALELS